MNFLDPTTGIVLLANAAIIAVIIFGKRSSTFWRGGACLACGVTVIGYLLWRLHYILYGGGLNSLDSTLTKLLFVFEVINFVDFFIFLLTMSRISDRTPEADRALEALRALPGDQWPRVDVFVATYNEEWEILEKTVLAIKLLDYPNKQGFLLDDGKRDWLKDKCEQIGFGYIRRPGNAHKKPGNHNYALTQTSAPFIAMFDADFIPMPGFLLRTVGLLLQNPGWGIVQTPQTFYNYDPMRSNLRLQRSLPDDTAMFFTVMEPCRDAWGCAFYVGSSALLRRKAIEDIGGIVMGYDTEDQITSIAMLQSGYRTGFLNEPLSTGLAPESLKALFDQRKRWARGSVQILFSKHGPLGPGLTLLQRVFFSQFFWLVGFVAPIVYASIPALMWLFQLRLFPYMPPEEVLLIPLFLFFSINMTIWWLAHGKWLPFVSPALQLLLSLQILPVIAATLVRPFGKSLLNFAHVTPKGKGAHGVERINWGPLRWLVAIIVCTGAGIGIYLLDDYKFVNHPEELMAIFLWTAINLIIVVIAALGCIGPAYRRSGERFPLEIGVTASVGGEKFFGKTRDVSLHGCSISFDLPADFGGGPIDLHMEDIGTASARVVRRKTPQEFAIEFLDLPKPTQTALFTRIFLNPDNHCHHLEGPEKLYADCFRRMFGAIDQPPG